MSDIVATRPDAGPAAGDARPSSSPPAANGHVTRNATEGVPHSAVAGASNPAAASADSSLVRLSTRLKRHKVTRIGIEFLDRCADIHLKDLVIDDMDDHRGASILGRRVVNFGSDSFLGLDRDERVQKALIEALPRWGTHNGASRAFSSVKLCEEAERRLARWLGVEDTLIFPSVTLANAGLIPALAAKGDLLVVDRQSHDSIHQGTKIAIANGAKVVELHPCRGDVLEPLLAHEGGQGSLIAVDGVYSMTGKTPPLAELDEVARRHDGLLYIDDAHGTGVVGPRGRGAASLALPSLKGVLQVGSLSKAFSCLGAYVTCYPELKRILKIRSSTFIFGGPVPPPYLAAVIAVCEILDSSEGDLLLAALRSLVARLTSGLRDLDLIVGGGVAPIVSVQVGSIEETFTAGKWLFDRGYYVQSATYPAVGINEGLIRIQVNANHWPGAIDGLIAAFADMKRELHLPTASTQRPRAVP
jgi:7-keto-8-aminopelargonate synthetase-like enzyme